LEVVVREQLDLLAKLQEKDRILEDLKRQVWQGPERIGEIERLMATHEGALEAYKTQLEETRKAQRQYEAELEDAAGHTAKSKSKLSTIKTNKEYQALLKEIEDADRVNREKEEKILDCMEEIERLNEVLRDEEKILLKEREASEKDKKAIEAEVSEAQGRLSAEEKQRTEMASIVDPQLLAHYERLRVRLSGMVVALVENTTCSGCHLNIPPQMYNELQRRDSLKFCPHCERIIYWKDRNAGSEDMSE
jgi:predicted  nucleic acid-binding Zn-ribbon protein